MTKFMDKFILSKETRSGQVLMGVIAAGLTLAALLKYRSRAPAPPADYTARIAARLDPEPLAPAPPTLEVPGNPVDRDWTRLAPGFSAVLRQLFARMASLGYDLVLMEGYRSPERQALLARAGRSPAGAMRSLHQHGLAADLGFLRDGRPAGNVGDPWVREAYHALGREAEQLGLVWGGSWATADLGHVQASVASPWCLWKTPPEPSPECP